MAELQTPMIGLTESIDLVTPRLSPTFWFYLFCGLWLHRYVRLIVHCFSHWLYKSYQIPARPTFTSKDVTVVIPTIHNAMEELRPSLRSIMATGPYELILVTTVNKFESLRKLSETLGFPNVRVLCTPVANKRLQVCEALPKVKTPLIIMADDDVTWPSKLMPWILAPFENPKIGGVGTCQRVKRITSGPISTRIFNWLGAAYIERRNFEISATHNIDGGTSCMSGRTGAYRADILQSGAFLEGFRTETWRNYNLHADDDNFVTRWLVRHQWKTWVQYERECEVETTLENNVKFLFQCSRWARSNWRSNWTSLVRERYVWKQQPWSTYALHIATFTSLAFLFDPLILASLWLGTSDWDSVSRRYAFSAQLVFMFAFTKEVKLTGLFLRSPSDIVFLPVSIVFGYLHGFIKLHALFTLNMTCWGSRADGDQHDSLRLTLRPRRSASLNTPPKKLPGLIRHKGEHQTADVPATEETGEVPITWREKPEAIPAL